MYNQSKLQGLWRCVGAAPQQQSLIHTQWLMGCRLVGYPRSGASARTGALRCALGTQGAPGPGSTFFLRVPVSWNWDCGSGEEGRSWQTGSISQLRGGGRSPQKSRGGSPRLCEALGGVSQPHLWRMSSSRHSGPCRMPGLMGQIPP